MANDFDVPFLGSIPMDPEVVSACDSGKPFINFNSQNTTVQAFNYAFEQLMKLNTKNQTNKEIKVK